MKIRILLADDHKIIRDSLCSLIGQHDEMDIIAEAGDGKATVDLALEHKPDVIVMDVNMPVLNGIEATRKILSKIPGSRIMALSMHSDKRFVREMLKAGAKGYMLKDCAYEEIIRAIHDIMNDQIYLSPPIANAVVDGYINKRETTYGLPGRPITQRETEVLGFLADGLSTKEIADTINLSAKTIESHRKNIMDKLGIFSIAELTKYAIREGISELDK